MDETNKGSGDSYKHKANDADNVHENVASATKSHGVEFHERLRSVESIERIEIRGAEQEENDDGEAREG